MESVKSGSLAFRQLIIPVVLVSKVCVRSTCILTSCYSIRVSEHHMFYVNKAHQIVCRRIMWEAPKMAPWDLKVYVVKYIVGASVKMGIFEERFSEDSAGRDSEEYEYIRLVPICPAQFSPIENKKTNNQTDRYLFPLIDIDWRKDPALLGLSIPCQLWHCDTLLDLTALS